MICLERVLELSSFFPSLFVLMIRGRCFCKCSSWGGALGGLIFAIWQVWCVPPHAHWASWQATLLLGPVMGHYRTLSTDSKSRSVAAQVNKPLFPILSDSSSYCSEASSVSFETCSQAAKVMRTLSSRNDKFCIVFLDEETNFDRSVTVLPTK